MKFYVTYVRQLPFHEEPDYEFLDHCLNFGNYTLMTAWHAQLKAMAETPDEAAPAAAASAPGAGSKRKRDKADTAEDERSGGAKKVKTEPPQEPCRAFMWFVISNNPLEGREAYTSHTTYQVRARTCATRRRAPAASCARRFKWRAAAPRRLPVLAEPAQQGERVLEAGPVD